MTRKGIVISGLFSPQSDLPSFVLYMIDSEDLKLYLFFFLLEFWDDFLHLPAEILQNRKMQTCQDIL